MEGIFAVNKPKGKTSYEVVDALKKLFTKSDCFNEIISKQEENSKKDKKRFYSKGKFKKNKKQWIKIGHGGTLDPLADGVLIIGVGKGTKLLSNSLGNTNKIYSATALLGTSTTTYDNDKNAKLLEKKSWIHLFNDNSNEIENQKNLNQNNINQAKIYVENLFEKYYRDKTILQMPPLYSALKMGGKPLYEYARTGEALPSEVKPREKKIYEIYLSKNSNDDNNKEPINFDHNYLPPKEMASKEEIESEKILLNTLLLAEKEKGLNIEPIIEGDDENDLKFKSNIDFKYDNDPIIEFITSVESGTYIRSLIHDLGRLLGTAAHMVQLRRIQQGEWILNKNVFELSDFIDQPEESWAGKLKDVFEHGPSVQLGMNPVKTETEASNDIINTTATNDSTNQ